MSQNMKHPLIIPNNTHLSDLLIKQGHQMTLHGGARVTQAWLRHQYWILGGNRAIKKCLRNCVKCRKHDPIKHEQLMGDLPLARSNPTRPFFHTGVDFTGFVDVKASKGRGIKTTKGYIAVFVCMATKAVHIELVSDLTSSSFLAALRRMAARRGTPGHVYSDNGTNFVGASRILNEEFVNIQNTLDDSFFEAIASMEINWHFNAPSWPSAGGLWEAAVKSLKYHLKRVIGSQKLTFEEYSTLLAQIEACLNSRPLCALSEDPEDLDCLTPFHFLASGPTLTIIETERDLRTRWQLTQKIFDDLWKRWRAEYLCQLSARSKWRKPHQNLKINDIVIIHDVNLPPGKWPMGRVIELHPGKDGYVRVVTLRTKNGTLKRPITKLSVLPINDNNQSHDAEKENQEGQTNNNKYSKPASSKLCNFIITTLILLMFICSGTCEHKISKVADNKNIFFDKVTNMKWERDEWKLIVYCDMAPYWQGMNLLNKFITHLDNICLRDQIPQCNVVRLQLTHGYNELEHYNNVLLGQQGQVRRRRGLINGIGYVAHSLFGVLDETFAEQYQKDIALIRSDQKHLSNLWRNQTSIVEAELNVIKRIENTLDKQHKILNQHITNYYSDMNKLKEEIRHTDNKAAFTLSTFIANNIMTNLKEIQETLVDTVANIYYEKFNFHLLTPAQLKNELNVITGQISKDLALPINNIQADLAKIYHLLKVKARVTREFLIFEVRIPLVSREDYELYNLIPIPQQANTSMVIIVPVAKYLAINTHKDAYIPVSTSDLQKCVPYSADEYICPLKRPIFQMTSDKNLCLKQQASNQCQTETRECQDSWTDLNLINSYLYFCCGQCSVRVICDNNITIEQLSKSGVITIGDSCVIKNRMFTIYAHRSLSNTIKTKIDVMNVEIPPINNLINLSIPLIAPLNETDDITNQQEDIKAIEKSLKEMKSNQELADQVTSHDIHHYVAIYTLVGAIVVCIILYAWQRMRACQSRPALAPPAAEQVETTTEQAEASVSYVAPVATAAGRPTIATASRGSSPSVRTQFNEIS
ncbi:uncharacterized protein LOC126911988 [Spodoptera frugiperda]|uniref:Uncharacterized protein LOC126911988 n=1 Tax=Spodoptera frugiperda TaxID=7108 RepID=A0A9R0E265_SPOFR|nr:uncharacterized protein LOC126911988 [Spodoptera frugiperda]